MGAHKGVVPDGSAQQLEVSPYFACPGKVAEQGVGEMAMEGSSVDGAYSHQLAFGQVQLQPNTSSLRLD